ncbi:MAG TPA: fatty acyl-AMP ligase [Pyrinomonadaceae bacterium]|jgi:acyl-CoA synthetase (AMP-forming)/AMP-acid ligase II
MRHPTEPLDSAPHFQTFVEVLRWRALRQPERPIFTFLSDGKETEGSFDYAELDGRARAIAAALQAAGLRGERALLLYPPGLEYVAAFFGALYAGVVAVPAYPLRSVRMLPRLLAIVADARPAVALTTEPLLAAMRPLLQDSAEGLRWLSTTDLDAGLADSWEDPRVGGETLAFLQYTSGSTALPKGVMLSHGNLLHNSALISRAYEIDPESRGVSWLPPYHDMGLIGQILMPMYAGAWMALMPPGAFLQRPFRWLEAVSNYRATHSGAPNFAYDLCVRKVTEEQRETLDLSHWRVAFNGAEPITAATLDSFAETFAPCGFRRRAFYPCYGLAEATLMVSCLPPGTLPVVTTVEAATLEQNVAVSANGDGGARRTLVSSGQTLPGQQIAIVNPELGTRCAPGEVGEIWVAGPSVAEGYWDKPEETAATFRAFITDTGEGPFLRTRDLGFLRDGELFVTGRLKDLIIILGRNLYPQDIELTVERSHAALRAGCGAAFSVTVDDEDRLAVVQEVEFRQKPDAAEVCKAIRRSVAEEHGVQLDKVVLIKPGSIAKTSSGKIQRHACKAAYLAGTLDVYEPPTNGSAARPRAGGGR